jgi:hypothetical protein
MPEHRRDNVVAGAERRGHVVAGVQDAPVVVGGCWIEESLPDAPAVEKQLVVAEAGGIQPSGRHARRQPELLPQQGRGRRRWTDDQRPGTGDDLCVGEGMPRGQLSVWIRPPAGVSRGA